MKLFAFILIGFFVLFLSCADTSENCSVFNEVNAQKIKKIGKFYSTINNWCYVKRLITGLKTKGRNFMTQLNAIILDYQMELG